MEEILLYRQVAAAIRDQIKDGELKSGYPVPSIKTLCRETGYSRQTIGKAFRILESDGLIKRIPGRGYYVE
jgi:DNA-binding GntR family transcriptional regulator